MLEHEARIDDVRKILLRPLAEARLRQDVALDRLVAPVEVTRAARDVLAAEAVDPHLRGRDEDALDRIRIAGHGVGLDIRLLRPCFEY